MNVRRRQSPASGEAGGGKIKGALTARKGGESSAKAIKNAVGMKPKSQGYKKIKGSVSG